MTPDLTELERLAAEATPGPWRISLPDDTTIVNAEGREVCAIDGDYNSPDDWPLMEANAALIVAAVNALPSLLADARRVARLEELVRRAEEAINSSYWQCEAENRHHDRTADKHEAIVRAWRTEARAALQPQPDGGV